MNLKAEWKKYENQINFNLSILPNEITVSGKWITYPPKTYIVTEGEFPEYIYFIKSGTALGIRNYVDGHEYNYFEINKNNGAVGLLEVFARNDAYAATIMSITEVVALRVESAIIYNYVMNNFEMLHRCITLVAQDLYKRSSNDGIFYYLDGLNRVRYYLVSYYDTHKEGDKQVIVDANYQDMAKSIGVSIRTVGRSIHFLKASKEILSKNKKIILTKENYQILFSNLHL